MTRKEKIELLNRLLEIEEKNDIGNLTRAERGEFQQWVKALEQELKWIPVSKRLPKVADCYAVTRKIGSDLMTDACFFDGMDTWHSDNRINHERNYLTDIVAWMPSLEPYKEESEGEK